MTSEAPDLEHLVGRQLEPGSFKITGEDNMRLEALLGAEPAWGRVAHPIYAFFAPARGLGTSIEDLIELVGFPLEHGPMLGSWELELHSDLRIDEPYEVSGEIVGIEHKSGRRAGSFDLFTVCQRLSDRDGRVAATATLQIVLRWAVM